MEGVVSKSHILLLATLMVVGCKEAPQAVQAACEDYCGERVVTDSRTGRRFVLHFAVQELSFHHGRWYCTCTFNNTLMIGSFDDQGRER